MLSGTLALEHWAFVPCLLPASYFLHPAQLSQNMCRSVLTVGWSVGITLVFPISYLMAFGSSQHMSYLRQGLAEQESCSVVRACTMLQRASIIMAANLNAKLFFVLCIPCNFDSVTAIHRKLADGNTNTCWPVHRNIPTLGMQPTEHVSF